MKPFRIACPTCHKKLTINKPELVGKRVKCPQCKYPLTLNPPRKKPAPKKAAPPEPVGESPVAVEPDLEMPVVDSVPMINVGEDDILAKARSRRKRRKSGAGLKWGIVSLFTLLSLGVIVGYIYVSSPDTENRPQPFTQSPAPQQPREEPEPDLESVVQSPLPVRGEPYDFNYVPTGTRLVLHWRPASLQQTDELWKSTGALMPWLDQQLNDHTGLSSSDLEWVQCFLIPGPRGRPPAVVFKFKPVDSFDLQGWTNRQSTQPELVDDFLAYPQGDHRLIWLDERTGLSVPDDLVEEALTTGMNPLPMTAGLDQLVKLSDRGADLSLLFDIKAVEIGLVDWFGDDERALVEPMLTWYGDDTEAVLWDVRVDEEAFHSRMEVQATPFTPSSKLKGRWQARVSGLGKTTWDDLRHRALHSVGAQTVLARFPAMLQLASRFTTLHVESKRVTMQTTLSERAAPNLALAGWLYWRERMLPESIGSVPVVADPGNTSETSTVADRLKSKLYVDFRLTPLQEAIEQISGEIKVPFQIDGDALKNEGYTQNMQQNYNLGEVTAEAALQHMLAQYPKMALVLREEENKAIVTTIAAAAAQQWPTYVFPAMETSESSD